MTNPNDTNSPPGIERDMLKAAIKAALRELIDDARQGKIQIAPGLPATADMVAEYRARLAFAVLLLNPPTVTTAADPKATAELDANLNRLLHQNAKLESPKKRKQGKKQGRR